MEDNELNRREFLQVSAATAAVVPTLGKGGELEAESLAIGSQRQIFVDDRLVDADRTRNVNRVPNPPADIRRVMVPDQPWESLGFIFYATVLADGEDIRLYYGSYGWDNKILRNFCLATSRDGVHFERPYLRDKTFGGQSMRTNILPLTAIEASVFLDPTAPPDKRYRLVYTGGGIDHPEKGGVYTAASADGIRWEKNPNRVLPFIPDSQHTAHWDAGLGKYVIYMRSWGKERRVRQVCRAVVDDIDQPWPYDASAVPIHHWGKDKTPTLGQEFPAVMVPDERDPENLDIYTNTVFPYAPGVFFAFPAVYLKFTGPDWKHRALSSNDGNFEVQLATSADGISWQRWRQPYVAAGFHDGLDLRLVSMAHGMVRRGRWLHQYFVGWPHTHGRPNVWDRDPADGDAWTRKDKGGIYLAKQRLDGFVSLDSAYTGGTLVTKPLTFSGNRLRLNLDTRGAGTARVALLDPGGQPLAGFALGDCEIINADDTDYTVRWRDGSDLAAWAGKPIRVQVEMRNTKLYALQFADA
jgi:hypothetical protein